MSPRIFVLLAACGPTATQIEMDPAEVNLGAKGATAPVTAKGFDNYQKPASVTGIKWTSADPAVVTVAEGPADADGNATATITATGSGRTVVTGAISEDVAGTVNVTVNVLATALAHAPPFLLTGETGTLAFTFQNEKQEKISTTATCAAEPPAVATLDGTKITAVAPGSATFKCTADGVSFETSMFVFGTNLAGLAASEQAVDNDYKFIRKSIGLLPEVKKAGEDNVKLTRFEVRNGKPKFGYELCGTPAKLEMTVKNFDGDPLPLLITGPCGASTFAADALPWKGSPWLAMLLEADKRGIALAKNETITVTAGAPDTWTMASGGKTHLVSKGGAIQ
jgi:hypothetical protein